MCIKNIIFQILRIKEAGVQSSSSENRSKIVSALEYISKHYTEEIMIGDLAECCHLSETHFRRLFQTDMNMTPVEYINLIRVQAACDLMKKEDCQMEQVAAGQDIRRCLLLTEISSRLLGSAHISGKSR